MRASGAWLGSKTRGLAVFVEDQGRVSDPDWGGLDPRNVRPTEGPGVAVLPRFAPEHVCDSRPGSGSACGPTRTGRSGQLAQSDGLLPPPGLRTFVLRGLSPGLRHHDSDVMWLDRDLIEAAQLALATPFELAERTHLPRTLRLVSRRIGGRFALDFAYEEWASDYRDSLHAVIPRDHREEPYRRTRSRHNSIGQLASRGGQSRSTPRRSRSSFRCSGSTAERAHMRQPPSSTRTTPPSCATTSGSSRRPSNPCDDR